MYLSREALARVFSKGKESTLSYFKRHYQSPSRSHWKHYVRDGLIIAAIAGSAGFMFRAGAATFTFTQSGWSGGATANKANHTSNRTSWTQYESASGLAVGSSLTLSASTRSIVDAGNWPAYGGYINPSALLEVMTISPDDKHMYSVRNSPTSTGVYVHTISTSTGQIAAAATPWFAVSSTAKDVTVSPDGSFVYVSTTGGNLHVFSRNSSTGSLSAVATTTIGASSVDTIVISPDGLFMYVGSGTNPIYMYSRNLSTGALTPLATPSVTAGGVTLYDIEISPDGTSAYAGTASNIYMYSRNVSTGILTPLGTQNITGRHTKLLISSDGNHVYSSDRNGSGTAASNINMFSRNTSDGSLSALSPSYINAASSLKMYDMKISSDGLTLYTLSGFNSISIQTHSRNPVTGLISNSLTLTNYTETRGSGMAIALTSDGKYLYTSTNYGGSYYLDLWKINKTVGAPGFQTGSLAQTAISGLGTTTAISIPVRGALTPLSPATVSTTYNSARDVVISSDGKSAYTGVADSAISMFSRSTSTGIITGAGTPIDIGTYAWSMDISPDGTSVYGTSNYSNFVKLFNRNTTTSLLTASSTWTVSAARFVKVSPDSAHVYVIAGAGCCGYNIFQYGRNLSTGALTPLSPASFSLFGGSITPGNMVISPDGTSAYVGNTYRVYMFSRNTSTGALTPLSPESIVAGTAPNSVAISPDGTSVYAANQSSSNISMYSRNVSTGLLTPLSPATIAAENSPTRVSVSPDGMSVYVTNQGSNTVSAYSRNVSTGALTALSSSPVVTGSTPFGLDISPDGAYVYVANNTSTNISAYSRSSGYTSGTFTSGVLDAASTAQFSTVQFTATTPAGTGVTIDVRAGNTATPDGTWTSWVTGLSSGGDISSLAGYRYAQYRLNLTTSDVAVSPSISTVTLNYVQYGSSGTVVSSPFNTESPANIISKIAWTATTPSGTVVKFQVRSAPDSAGSPGSWNSWMGPDGTSGSYFTSSDGSESMPAALRDGADDQWFQYKATLTQTSGATPTFSGVTVTYVVNAPPEFDAAFGTDGITASQVATSSDANIGKVHIQYKVRDTDSTSGSVTPGYVTPTIEYDIGGGWVEVASDNLSAGALANKVVEESTYTLYEAYVDVATLLPATYSTSARIRIKVNDNEGANNITYATSSAFTLDTKAPVISSLHIDGTSSTSTVAFSVTDDTTVRGYVVSNNADFSADGSNVTSGIEQSVELSSASLALPWTLSSGATKTVYVKVFDTRGNFSTGNVVVPATPSNIEYRDISNIDMDSYREFIAWNLYPDPVPAGAPFGSYKLYRSDDGTNYSLIFTSTNPAINYYIDTPVSTSTIYYYKVLFLTDNGDSTAFSPVVNDAPDGKGGTNNGALPLISAVTAAEVKNTSAKITWTTDDLALSEVDFGTSNSYGRVATNRSYVTSHVVYLTGLTPNTTYYYRVRSIDAFSVSATDSNAGNGYTFTTGGGPVISNVTVPSVNDNSAEISWKTNISADSYVTYSTSPDLASSTQAGSSDLVQTPFQHTVTLSGLLTDTLYYFKVTSTDEDDNATVDDNNGSYFTLRTTNDTRAPVISEVAVPVKASESAVITWRTDELSSSKVEYGTASGASSTYAFSTDEVTTPTIFHSITLSPQTLKSGGGTNTLTKLTKYYYRVKSTDPAGNTTYSTEGDFTTTEDGAIVVASGGYSISNEKNDKDTTRPTISDIKVVDLGPFSATVSFATDEDTRAIVQYGTTVEYGSTAGAAALSKQHKIVIRGLKMGTKYNFAINAVDKAGNVSISANQEFQTTNLAEDLGSLAKLEQGMDTLQEQIENLIESALPSVNPPFIEKPTIEEVGEDFVRISWKTNVKAYGSIVYAEDAEFAKTGQLVTEQSKTDAKRTEHVMDLSNLRPNTKYRFKVKSYVFVGADAQSGEMTFTTRAGRVQAQIQDRKKDSMRVVWTTPVPTNSLVSYKVRGSQFASRKEDDGLTTSHSVLLDNLTPKTMYEIRVSGTTPDGNTIEARDAVIASTNEDSTPPSITNFKVDSALVPGRNDRTQTIVSWKTDEPATSVVYYDEGPGSATASLSQSKDNGQTYVDNHVVILTNLKPGTIYRFQIVSIDDANNQTKLPVRTIVTPSQSESVVDVIFKNFDETFKFMRSVR